MAADTVQSINALGNHIITTADADSTAVKVGDTSTVYAVYVNNPNSGKVFVRLYNLASPTVGSNAPDVILMFPNGARQYSFPEGVSFGTALSYACVTEAGTSGSTSPSSNVSMTIIASVT
jgi:hypothetical protein